MVTRSLMSIEHKLLAPAIITIVLTTCLVSCQARKKGNTDDTLTPPQPTSSPQPSKQSIPTEPMVFQDYLGGISNDKGIISHIPSKGDRKNLRRCMDQWGFQNSVIPNRVKKIKAAVSVFADGVVLRDAEVTQGPALILISAGVNVLGKPIWRLENPNGYYCLNVAVNVLSDVTIQKARGSAILDPTVNVGVKNNGTPVGRVSVQVGSRVKVEDI